MKMRIRRCFLLSFTSLLFSVGLSFAQGDPTFTQGLKAYGSYHGGDIDHISLENGKLDLHAPLLSYPQRGDLQMNFTIRYNNPTFSVTQICVEGTNCQYLTASARTAGWLGQGVSVVPDFGAFSVSVAAEGSTFMIDLPDGGSHETGNTSGNNWESIDASGWLLSGVPDSDKWNINSAVITDPNGTRYSFANGSVTAVEDRNGNQITGNGSVWTDSLGRSIPYPPGGIPPGGTAGNSALCPTNLLPVLNAYAWTVPAPANAGGTATYTFCYANVQLDIVLPWPGGGTFYPDNGTLTMLQSIVLPNGQSWNFSYDSYGDLSQITLPTGGTISYGWGTVGSCRNGTAFIPPAAYYYPVVGSRTVNANDGTGAHTWTYGGGYLKAPGTSITRTITDPAGNQDVHTLTPLTSTTCSLFETQVQKYQGSSTAGTLLQTTNTAYSFSPDPYLAGAIPTGVINVVPTSITTIWPTGSTKNVTKTYDSGFYFYNPAFGTAGAIYGKVMSESDSDYGSGSAGPLLRRTVYNYQAFANSSYLTYNILDPLASEVVYDSASTQCKGVANTFCAYTYYGYDESSLKSSGISTQHDSSPVNGSYRANQTSVHKWLNGSTVSQSPCNVSVSNGYLVSSKVFFDTGEVQQSSDPCGYATSFLYSSTYVGALPTTTTNPLNQNTTYTYDFNTGAMTSVTDPNLQTTTSQYDILTRLTQVSYPDGGSTSYCYTDTGGSTCTQSGAPYEVVITKAITSSPMLNETSTIVVDGLGRLSQTQLNSDPSGTTYTQTIYDALGRKYQVYNPTRCSPITTNCGETTWGYSTYNYDGLSRITSVVEQDGSTLSTSYTGNCTTVTDEAGNSRKSCVDGLGRLTGVWEAPSGLNYETDYGYDALDDLLSVTQKGSNSANARTRSFQYDSLSHLTSAANPESGTITYGYDADGNVITKTALSPNQLPTGTKTVATTYTYDKLNRLAQKSYNDGYTSNTITPGASYAYDGNTLAGCAIAPPGLTDSYPVGRRTSMCDGSGGTSWAHDTMGRILQERRTIGTIKGDYENDAFNLDGSVKSVTTLGYGVSYTYSGAARPLTAMHSATNLVTGATYAPPGELAGMTLGSATGFAGITVAKAYSDRLQPIMLSAASPSGTVFSECFDFHLGVAVNTAPCSFSASTLGDNGNVYQIVNNRDNTRTQNFNYDSLNRIQQAYSSGSHWGETFGPTATSPGVAPTTPGIDSWGNLTNRSGVTGKTNYEPLSVSAATNNRLSGFGYDPAGNMTSNGSTSYVYDDENRLIATAGTSYLYDGDGQRVEKCTEGSTPGTCATSATGTLYWRGSGAAPLTETDLSGNAKNTYIFFNGQRVARSDSTGAIHYYFSDHLGTHAVVENATGTACEQDIDYYPYGGEQNDYCTTQVPQNYKFTGKERDAESGLDNFGARYNASSLGRFMTPDWAAKAVTVPYAKFGDPQTLNLYSYVENGPLNRIDADGHFWLGLAGAFCNAVISGCNAQTNAANATKDAAPAQNKKPPAETSTQKVTKRIVAGISGVLNIALGVGKIKLAAGLGVASTVDGPAAVATGTGAAYLGINGTGQVLTGTANLTYAATGDNRAEQAAQVLTATTTVGGLYTLAKTGGDVKSAATVGQVEGSFQAAVSSWFGRGLESAVEVLNNALEVANTNSNEKQQPQQ